MESEESSEQRADEHEEHLDTVDDPTSDDDAKGALQKDEPEIGKGTGEGERGLGTQTGAVGGDTPTEPEDATPERAQGN